MCYWTIPMEIIFRLTNWYSCSLDWQTFGEPKNWLMNGWKNWMKTTCCYSSSGRAHPWWVRSRVRITLAAPLFRITKYNQLNLFISCVCIVIGVCVCALTSIINAHDAHTFRKILRTYLNIFWQMKSSILSWKGELLISYVSINKNLIFSCLLHFYLLFFFGAYSMAPLSTARLLRFCDYPAHTMSPQRWAWSFGV